MRLENYVQVRRWLEDLCQYNLKEDVEGFSEYESTFNTIHARALVYLQRLEKLLSKLSLTAEEKRDKEHARSALELVVKLCEIVERGRYLWWDWYNEAASELGLKTPGSPLNTIQLLCILLAIEDFSSARRQLLNVVKGRAKMMANDEIKTLLAQLEQELKKLESKEVREKEN